MTIQEATKDLYRQYKGRDWFYSIRHSNTVITVYTNKKMDSRVNNYFGYKVEWIYYKGK